MSGITKNVVRLLTMVLLCAHFTVAEGKLLTTVSARDDGASASTAKKAQKQKTVARLLPAVPKVAPEPQRSAKQLLRPIVEPAPEPVVRAVPMPEPAAPRSVAPAVQQNAKRDAPSQMSLLDDDWKLKIGDRMVYEVLEEREEPSLLVVNANGKLLVPLIGLTKAEGKTTKTLAYEIKKRLERDFFHRATVVISQREADRNSGRVTVIGEVNKQGEQLIPADAPLTLSQAVLQGGRGFTLSADKSQVSVVSAGAEEARLTLDLGQMLASGDLSQDPILQADDVVIVARADREAQVYVLGAVQAPGLYSTVGRKYTLSEVILMASGFTRFARKNKVRLITTDSKGERTEREINVGKVLDSGDRSEDPVVKPGDMIIVEEKMISFSG